MKILMATMGMNIGGAETHILERAKELKHQGHDVIIVSNGGVYVPEIEAAGIRHYQAPMHRRGFREMRRSRTILRDIRRGPCPCPDPGVPVRQPAKTVGVPLCDHCPLGL